MVLMEGDHKEPIKKPLEYAFYVHLIIQHNWVTIYTVHKVCILCGYKSTCSPLGTYIFDSNY